MKALSVLCLAILAGCASSQEYVAAQSNWDVCRLTMGGPHSAAAEAEARNRGVDCRPMYPAIAAQNERQNAAVRQYMQPAIPPLTYTPIQPPRTINCNSYRFGNTVQTDCR